MNENKVTKISISTFFLIVSIIVIFIMGFFLYKLNDEEKSKSNLIDSLKNEISLLKNNQTELDAEINEYKNKQIESKENINLDNTTSKNIELEENSKNNNTTKNTEVKENEKQINVNEAVVLGYNQIAILINEKVYAIPVFDRENNYDNYKLYEVKGLKGNVKAIKQFYLGTDPSETNYFIMEDGSVYIMNGFGKDTIAEKVLESSKNITNIIEENGSIFAISKNGVKNKIADRNKDV